MDRSVTQVIKARHQTEGGGFKVRRPLPSAGLRYLDPILLIDEMGPVDYQPGEAVGAPDHPHRGFETVTYMLDGEFEHRDSAGHAGRLQPGDVQWMTAGRGVVHSEMPASRIMQQGGRVHGFQIWVNLPARLKMTQPRYQEVAASSIPEAVSDDGLARVRVIAGEALGVSARIDTHTPIIYQHWILQPGDEQWMTAGRGVVHSEMPASRIMHQGGRVHGFQIWVNLPARLKMTQPRYQEVAASSIPEAVSDDGLARGRVIAGEALGVSARIDTHTPIIYQHWILQPGAQVSQSLPSDCNAMLYVFSGAIESSGKALLDGELGILGKGDSVDLSVPATAKDTAQLLLLGGEALAEPVVQHGPFVMNTREEINQAISDYQQGHMGIIQQARQ